MSYTPNEPAELTAFKEEGLLANGATFSSDYLDADGYTQVQTEILASHDGTIAIQFCSDAAGVDVVRSLSIPYVAANGYQFFAAPAFANFIRYQFTNTGGVTQTSFYYTTKFTTTAIQPQLLTTDAFIAPAMVANLGRNIIVGQDPAGTFRNVPTDTEGHLKINLHDPVTAFGDLRVAELTPKVHLTFPYNINTDIVDTTVANGGTVTAADSMAVVQTSAATNGEAEFSSRRVLTYRSGLGGMVRFTALFTTGVASSTQYIGVGDETDGFFFGYDGITFGILRRQDGVEFWEPQTSWNVDVMDGNDGAANPSNVPLDTTKINVFQINYQWLGAGQIEFSVEDPNTGLFVPVHRIKYANANTIPSIYNANLPLHAHVVNEGNASNITLKTASMAAFVEGKSIPLGPTNNFNASKSISTEEFLFSLRNKATINSVNSRVRMILKQISAGNDANALSTIRVYSNATLDITPTWTNVNGDDSCVEVDTTADYVSGGRLLFQGVVGKDSGATFDLDNLDIQIVPSDIITITAEAGQAGVQSVALTWQEDY